jgi:diguanylate cyclase (GGDEF)-like protein/PAS domain S-box-containing protein
MLLSRKLAIILISIVLIVTTPLAIGIYYYYKTQLLTKESLALQSETEIDVFNTFPRFRQEESRMNALAKLMQIDLSEPANNEEVNFFDEIMQRNEDGAWRTRPEQVVNDRTAGIFLPPDAKLDANQKAMHIRIKKMIDAAAFGINDSLNNLWFLSRDKTEVIADIFMPDFVMKMAADADYTKTPWVTLGDPATNPERKMQWTKPTYDPALKTWLVSSVKPVDVNGQWIGTIGQDMYLPNMFHNLFKKNQRYVDEQHFLLDKDGNYLQAGFWQQEFIANPDAFKPQFSQAPLLEKLFKQKVNNNAQVFAEEVRFKNQNYLAIYTSVMPMGWRYYRLVPINQILAPLNKLFTIMGVTLVLIGLLIGALVHEVLQKVILSRISTLARKVYKPEDKTIAPSVDMPLVSNTKEKLTVKPVIEDDINLASHGIDIALQQLRDNERELRLLIDSIPGTVARVNRELRYEYVNKKYELVFGKRPKWIIGKTMLELQGEVMFSRAEPYVKRALLGERCSFESEVVTEAGIKLTGLVHLIPNLDDNNQVIGLFILGLDITQVKIAESEIVASRNLLRTIIDIAPVQIYWKDKDSRYLGANKAFALDANLKSHDDLIGKLDTDLLWAHNAEQYQAEDRLVIESGKPLLNYEHKLARPNGMVTWAKSSKVPLKNMDGEIIGVLGVDEDITLIKAQELEIQDSRNLLLTIIDNAPLSIFWKDINSNYLGYNAAFIKEAELENPEDLIGKNDYAAKWSHLAEKYINEDNSVMKSGISMLGVEEQILGVNGKMQWHRGSSLPLKSLSGEIIGMLGISEDITERKLLEQANLEEQKRLTKIASSVPGIVYQFLLRPDGSSCFPYASEAISYIYRVSPEEVREDASKVFAIIHPEDYDDLVTSIQISAKDLTLWREEFRVKYEDGTERWLFGNSFPELQANGDVIWHGFIADITEQKRLDQSLEESEARWKFAIEGAGDGVWDVNVQTQKASYSKRWKEMLGFDENEELTSRKEWIKRIHPEDKSRVLDAGDAYLAGKSDTYVVEYRLKCRDGEYKWMQSRGMLVSRDKDGKPLRMIGTQTDITERVNSQIALQQAKEELEASLDRFKDLYEFAPIGYLTLNKNGLISQLNWRASAMLGMDRRALTGKRIAEFVDENEKLRWTRHYQDLKALEVGEELSFDIKFTLNNSNSFHANLNCIKVPDVDGESMLRIALEDISQIKKSEAESRVAAIAFETNDAILITDAENKILKVNHAFTKIAGYTDEEVVGKNPRILASDRHNAAFFESVWESINNLGQWSGELWNKRKNGEVFPSKMTITAVKTNKGIVTNYVGTFTDISYLKAAEDEIQQLAFYDSLTRLPNRRLLMDRLKQAIASSVRSGRHGAILFLDLDHFKVLNDSRGHDVGDLLLQQVAERLTQCVREGDTVARLGGDEYIVVLEDLSEDGLETARVTETIAKKIIEALNQPYLLAEHEHHSTASIGVSIFGDEQISIEDLLKQADIAMYQAKKVGRNTMRFFNPQMQTSITARVSLERELRKAIDKKQFALYYQIQVDHAGHHLGAEALIRWIDPDRGLVSPAQFIPLAEETGLILPIGNWVLNAACAQIKEWQKDDIARDLTLSINVSAKQFRQSDFVAQVKSAIERHSIDPMQLKLELTESLLLENFEETINAMLALGEIGVQFSLDDFGTGYSSLQYLKKLPLYQLKIDQSFVRDIVTDSHDRSIVRTIIAMAQSLYLNVIAEGVETEQQKELLLSHGCKRYQGYLFGKPMPIKEFNASLKSFARRDF